MWRLHRLVRSGQAPLKPVASMETTRTYFGAIVGVTVGSLVAEVRRSGAGG